MRGPFDRRKRLGDREVWRCSICGRCHTTHTTTAAFVLAGHRAAHKRAGKGEARFTYIGNGLPLGEAGQ